MKLVKSVLSASILAAAVSTATAAEFEAYGSVQPMYNPEGGSTYDGISDANSHFGYKINTELGNGLTLSVKHEIGINEEFTNLEFSDTEARHAFIELGGDFGNVSVGRNYGPAYNAVGYVADMFYWNTTGSKIATTRLSETLFYSAPSFNGLSVEVAFDTTDNNHNEIGITYKVNDNLSLSASNVSSDTATEENSGIAAKYTRDDYTIMVSREEADNATGTSVKEASNLYISYTLNDSTSIAGHIADQETAAGVETNPAVVGFYHSLMDGLSVWAEYSDYDNGTEMPTIGLDYRF